MTLAPLSRLELRPKEAWELAILKHWLLVLLRMVQDTNCGACTHGSQVEGAGECLRQVSGWYPHGHISFINN